MVMGDLTEEASKGCCDTMYLAAVLESLNQE
jgi:hypothetical protein